MKKSQFPLDMEVIRLIDNQNPQNQYIRTLTLADCCRNFSCVGSVGAGKSTGFLLSASLSMANKGFSMVVPVAKTDELERWKLIHEKSKTKGKFINWTKDSGLKFDPLLYLSSVDKDMDTLNIVQLFISISKTISRINGYGGGFGSDDFWIREVSKILKHGVNLLKLSGEQISFDHIHTLITEMYIMKSNSAKPDTKNFPFLFECMIKAQTRNAFDGDKSLVKLTLNFIKKEFISMPEKTSGNIQAMVQGLLDPFTSGTLRDVMVGGLSEELIPENILKDGSVVLVNFPIISQYEIGAIIQSIFMRMMCQAIERRNLKENDRPCCLVIDEAHYHVDDHLIRAMSTGRSKRMIVLLASQSISAYLSSMDGHRYKEKVDTMMSHCVTKICCNANDYETLEFYMRTVSKGYLRVQERDSKISNFQSKERFFAEHSDFKKLKTGGAPDYVTESIIVTTELPEGKHFIKASFDQKLLEKL